LYEYEKELGGEREASSDSNTDDWTVVRRLRVFSTNLGTSSDSEDVYDAVDVVCLASTMFNKLLIAGIEQGLREANMLARDWLVTSLQSIYRSAEAEEVKVFAGETTVNKSSLKRSQRNGREPLDFKARLMNRAGSELSDRDILLAQGHNTLSALPLLIYSLMNCDALRPSEGAFQPSVNARLAAAVSLTSMDPAALVKMLVPRLELWNSAFAQGPAVDRVSLGNYSCLEVIAAVDDKVNSEALLLMDSPRGIVVYFVNTMGTCDVHELGKDLERELLSTASEYRCSPGTWCVRAGGDEGWRLTDGLVEDSSVGGGYSDWCDGVSKELLGAGFG